MAPPKPTGPGLGHSFMTFMSALHVWLYRILNGRFVSKMGNAPILLLTTTGHKSGQPRTVPVLYLETGNDYAIVGSYAGADKPPAWLTNLLKTPSVQIQVGARKMRVDATVAPPQRKAELWPKLVAIYPDYQVYQNRTSREIPVVLLSPAA